MRSARTPNTTPFPMFRCSRTRTRTRTHSNTRTRTPVQELPVFRHSQQELNKAEHRHLNMSSRTQTRTRTDPNNRTRTRNTARTRSVEHVQNPNTNTTPNTNRRFPNTQQRSGTALKFTGLVSAARISQVLAHSTQPGLAQLVWAMRKGFVVSQILIQIIPQGSKKTEMVHRSAEQAHAGV